MVSRWQVTGTFDREALVSTTASPITSDEMIPNMAEDGQRSVVFELEDLPLLVPQRVGGLQVVLLRQSVVDDESWELDYAAVGRITGELVVGLGTRPAPNTSQQGAGAPGTPDCSSAPKRSLPGWERASPRSSSFSPSRSPSPEQLRGSGTNLLPPWRRTGLNVFRASSQAGLNGMR